KNGFEGDDFILGLCEHFRNLLFCKDSDTLALLEVSENLRHRYATQSSLASSTFLVNGLQIGNQCDVQYKTAKNKRLSVELALIKRCYITSVVTIEADPGKKKLKTEVARPEPEATEISKTPVRVQANEKPVQATLPRPEDKRPPVTLPKTKK